MRIMIKMTSGKKGKSSFSLLMLHNLIQNLGLAKYLTKSDIDHIYFRTFFPYLVRIRLYKNQ